jgi:hypothetical protein
LALYAKSAKFGNRSDVPLSPVFVAAQQLIALFANLRVVELFADLCEDIASRGCDDATEHRCCQF